MKHNLAKKIAHLKPCQDAAQWLAKQPSAIKAWRNCQRGDWMFWLLVRTMDCPQWSLGRRAIVACALDCARLNCPTTPSEIEGAVQTLRDWVEGVPTVEDIVDAVMHLIKSMERSLNNISHGKYSEYKAAIKTISQLEPYAYTGILFLAPLDNHAKKYAAAAAYKVCRPSQSALSPIILSNTAEVIRSYFPRPPRIYKRTGRRVCP